MSMFLSITDGALKFDDVKKGGDFGYEKREAERKARDKAITSAFAAIAAVVVAILPIPGARAAAAAISIAASTAASIATTVVGNAISGDLDEETGIDAVIDVGVAVLTLGASQVAKPLITASKTARHFSRAIKTATKTSKALAKKGTKNAFSDFVLDSALKNKKTYGSFRKILTNKTYRQGTAEFISNAADSTAKLAKQGAKQGVKNIGKLSLSDSADYFGKLAGRASKSANALDNIIKSSTKISSVGDIIQVITKTLLQKFQQFVKQGLNGSRLAQALKRFQKGYLARIKKFFEPITKRLKVLRDKYRKIVGGDYLKEKFEKRKLDNFKEIQQSPNESETKRLLDMDNYATDKLNLAPLTSSWILGYKIYPQENEEIVTLSVYFRAELSVSKVRRRKRKRRAMKDTINYKDVPIEVVENFVNAASAGKFYLDTFARGKWVGGYTSNSVSNQLLDSGKVGKEGQYGIDVGVGLGRLATRQLTALGVKLLYKQNKDIQKYWNKTREVSSWITRPFDNLEQSLFKQAKRVY